MPMTQSLILGNPWCGPALVLHGPPSQSPSIRASPTLRDSTGPESCSLSSCGEFRWLQCHLALAPEREQGQNSRKGSQRHVRNTSNALLQPSHGIRFPCLALRPRFRLKAHQSAEDLRPGQPQMAIAWGMVHKQARFRSSGWASKSPSWLVATMVTPKGKKRPRNLRK